MLRDAFNKTMKDADFIAEAKKKRLDLDRRPARKSRHWLVK
jgi:hypothetical protein